MRRALLIASLVLVACAATAEDATAPPKSSPAVSGAASPNAGGPFSGTWDACEGATSPDECSRYVLVQRGERICGTWFYIASGDGYDGRLMAQARSATDARRRRVCGRPGSEASTECSDGWDPSDEPLRICDGRLADSASADGACNAQFARVEDAEDAAALAREPWVRECLAARSQEDTQ